MKKIIGTIFSLGLAITFLVATVSAAPNLSGSWSGFGYSFKAQQSGGSITLIATDGDIKGKVSFQGTITGNSVAGQQIMIAKGCPNLEKYVPATGTIASDGSSITITYKNFNFDPSRCVDMPGNEFEEIGSYTKVGGLPAPTKPPQPTQTPQVRKATPTPTVDNRTDQLPVEQNPNLTEKPAEKSNPFNIFGIGGKIISDMLAKGTVSLFDSVVEMGNVVVTGKTSDKRTPLEFTPAWFEMKRQQFAKSYERILNETILKDPTNYQVYPPVLLPGEEKSSGSVKIKLPGNQQLIELTESQEIQRGSVLETTKPLMFQTKRAIFRITPLPGSKGIVELGEIPMLLEGELDVIYEKANDEIPLKIQTPDIELIVIGTQFSVIYDKKESKSSVAVYEGKVEVKAKDGQIITITPDDHQPGVMAVTQKLSIVKLTLVGLVLAAIIGGLILRRKIFSKIANKKKK